MDKVKAAIDLSISALAGISAGIFTLQFMVASIGLSRGNAQKRGESKEHMMYTIAAALGSVLAKSVIGFFMKV